MSEPASVPHSGGTVRVAVDLPGADHDLAAVLEGARRALDADPLLRITLVGPASAAALWHGPPVEVVAGSPTAALGQDPVRAIRASRDASVRVATTLVRDGAVDAAVSTGPLTATLAAGVFTLGRLPGVTRPSFAVVVHSLRGPLVLLDAGANRDCDAALLGQFALAGSAYARVLFGAVSPGVGLLSTGEGDALRAAAHGVLRRLPLRFVGDVTGRDVVSGGAADVVVTDGFTAGVLLEGIDAALAGQRDAIDAGAVLLGLGGVVVACTSVVAGAADVAGCLAAAVQAVRGGVVPAVSGALAELVRQRRVEAGLDAVAP